MTIAQAISRADALMPNQWTEAQKIQMLSDCDSAIYLEIMSTHATDDTTPTTFAGYASDVDTSTVLLVGAPYDILYIRWLHAQYEMYNREIVRYNNMIALYDVAYADYAAYYNRTHLPLQAATYIDVGGAYETATTYTTDPI